MIKKDHFWCFFLRSIFVHLFIIFLFFLIYCFFIFLCFLLIFDIIKKGPETPFFRFFIFYDFFVFFNFLKVQKTSIFDHFLFNNFDHFLQVFCFFSSLFAVKSILAIFPKTSKRAKTPFAPLICRGMVKNSDFWPFLDPLTGSIWTPLFGPFFDFFVIF